MRARKLVVGYFAQHQLEELDGAITPIQTLRAAAQADAETECARSWAASASPPTRR